MRMRTTTMAVLALAGGLACGGGASAGDAGRDVPAEVADAGNDPDLPANPDGDAPGDLSRDLADDGATADDGDPGPDALPDVPVEIPPPDRPLCAGAAAGNATRITVDPAGPGRLLDGLGAISSAGNSRFLIDYPEPRRGDLLDFLFKPGVGAALQVLKVEIPGDMNSTSGAEASHRHAKEDRDCGRGSEWWLMQEAKRRNPAIRLAALPWGSPAWTGTAIFTPELIDYLVSWLDCAADNGLAIDYIGTRNENGWDAAWLAELKAALQASGHGDTRIVAADTHQVFSWLFGTILAGDPALSAAVDVLGVHYPCFEAGSDGTDCTPPEEVLSLPQPIWASEQGGDPPSTLARLLTRGYVDARITGTHLWPMASALPEGVPFPDSGLLVAPEPWSGHWRPRATAWTFAHQTWFTESGWQYLDGASGYLGGERGNGAYVTLVSPDRSHATILVETTTAAADQVVEVAFAGALPRRVLHAWESDVSSWDTAAYLHHDCDLDPAAGPVRLALRPGRLYTLTTTWGQALQEAARPAGAPFPLPWSQDLETAAHGREPPFVLNANGSFEPADCGGGRPGKCLAQAVPPVPVFWIPQISEPLALVGDKTLTDVAVSAAAMPQADGAVVVMARYFDQQYFAPRQFAGYDLRVGTDGAWALRRHDPDTAAVTTLASGTTDPWVPGTWKTVALEVQGASLRGLLDGAELGTATDATWTRGLAGFGLDGASTAQAYFPAQFDDLQIRSLP
jgi:hypothetical protein